MKKHVLVIAVCVLLLALVLFGCASHEEDTGEPSSSSASGDTVEETPPEQGAVLTEQIQKAKDYQIQQAEADAAIQKEMENGYTLEEPLVR